MKPLRIFPTLLIVTLAMPHHPLLGQNQSPPSPELKTRNELGAAAATPSSSSESVPMQAPENTIEAGRVIRVALDRPLPTLSKLHSGSELDGQLMRPVFLGDKIVIPQGVKVHLVVDRTEKKPLPTKPARGVLDRVERIRSLKFKAPTTYSVFLKPVSLTLPGGNQAVVQASFIRGGEVVSLHPKGNDLKIGDSSVVGQATQEAKAKVQDVKDAKKKAKATWDQYRHPMVTLRLDQAVNFPAAIQPRQAVPPAQPAEKISVPAGATARLLLLSALNSSESTQGETFQALLQEPIIQDGKTLLPEGCVFVGHVARIVAPRRLSRAGSLQLVFDSIKMPDGNTQKVVASLSGVETDSRQAAKMDAEGGIKGGHQSKKQAVAAAAVAIVAGHLVDEAVSSPIEAAASTAAGSALGPVVGVGTGVLFYLAGRGKDAELSQYTDLEITFGRPLIIPLAHPGAGSESPALAGTDPKPQNK